MKKLLLGVVAMLILFASCSKCHDDDNSDIVGQWKRTQYYGNDVWGSPFEWHNGNDGTTVIFKSNGEYWRGEAKASVIPRGYYKIINNTIEISETRSSATIESFPYELNNNELTLKYSRTEGTQEEKFNRN